MWIELNSIIGSKVHPEGLQRSEVEQDQIERKTKKSYQYFDSNNLQPPSSNHPNNFLIEEHDIPSNRQ